MPLIIISAISAAASTVAAYSLYLKVLLGRAKPAQVGAKGDANPDRHLILVVWAFPPVVSGGVYRPLSFVQAAVESGWKVTVICGPAPVESDAAGLYLAGRIPESVAVHRISPPKLRPSHNWFPRIDGGFLNALAIADASVQHVGRNTVVLASGPPFSTFVGGLFLSKRLGAPLVLDYRDEWTQCPFDFVTTTGQDDAWESRCLHAASSILVTTRSFVRQIKQAFPFVQDTKLKLIPNGYDPADFVEVSSEGGHGERDDERITIAYLGYLAEHIDPEDFIATFEQTLVLMPELRSRLCLRFVGRRDPIVEAKFRESGLTDLIEFVDQVSKQEAARMMTECDAVLLFNPPRLSRYLPGKLFDYVASGATTLVYGSGGEIQDAVEKSSTGEIVVAGDPRSLGAALKRLSNARPNKVGTERLAWLHAHERRQLANQMLEHLEGVLELGS